MVPPIARQALALTQAKKVVYVKRREYIRQGNDQSKQGHRDSENTSGSEAAASNFNIFRTQRFERSETKAKLQFKVESFEANVEFSCFNA